MTWQEAYKRGTARLQQCGVEEAGADAWILLEEFGKIDRAHYFLRQMEEMPEEAWHSYECAIAKRAQRIPVQQITGKQEFCGLEFQVNEKVLIPRQDTETLVEEALRLLKGRQKPRVLDMCTGSGCILTSILLEVPDASGTGADLSEKALKVAACNARRLQTADRAEFVKSDLFSSEYFSGSVYDVLISNPPYISTEEIEELMEEVRLHDPRMALDGKADGLYFYRAITKQAMDYMLPGGWLLYEIGWNQGKAVKELLDKEGFINTEIKKDLCGLDRVVLGQKSLQEEQNV